MKAVDVQISRLDGTRKYLFELRDGNVIESVLMRYHHGNSVCISTQAGCRMGCRFCASTIGGLKRNLTTSEMLRQIYQIQKITQERVSNIVVMGTGEPLDNYDNFVRFIRMISSDKGLQYQSEKYYDLNVRDRAKDQRTCSETFTDHIGHFSSLTK